MNRNSKLSVLTAAAILTALGAAVVGAQEKYALKSPSGIAFSDFKGYEDWSAVSSARTDEVLKVILANPLMIKALLISFGISLVLRAFLPTNPVAPPST